MRLDQLRINLRDAINEETVKLANKVASGRCATFDEYKQAVGRMQGHSDAIEALEQVFAKLLNEDEDD